MSNETKRSTRKGRPNHPIEFKRRLAHQPCDAGVSVSRLAQEHGVNANLLFKWRRQYRAGLFDEAASKLHTDDTPIPVLAPGRGKTNRPPVGVRAG